MTFQFYQSLPNYHETYREEGKSGLAPAIPRPDIYSLLSVSGTAILSSIVLATAIKSWLQSRNTKITIEESKSKTKVTYEGPNLNDPVSKIQELLEGMKGNALDIRAEHLDRTALTASQWRLLHNSKPPSV